MENGIGQIALILSGENLLLIALLFGVLQWLIALWIKTRVTQSIKHEYDIKLENIKSDIYLCNQRKQQSAMVAELLAEWVKKSDDKSKLNKLLWEASLWLPDEEAKDINNLLACQGIITTKMMIIKIRKIIHGKDTTLTEEDITHFE